MDVVLTRAESRDLDRRAIEVFGIPSFTLMESAGRSVADDVERALPSGATDPAEASVLVLCGPGNNGGDGLVVARTLANRGRRAEVTLVGTEEAHARGSEDVQRNLRLWRGIGGLTPFVSTPDEVARLADRMASATVVVDALFGTGLTRALDSPYRDVVGAIGACGRPVVAVDVPSGLDADTGEVLGAAVRADRTVTFVAPKRGLLVGRGPDCAGRVEVVEIGIPRAWLVALAESRRG